MSKNPPKRMTKKTSTRKPHKSALARYVALARQLITPPSFLRLNATHRHTWKRTLIRRSFLLVAAACCGLLIARSEKLLLPTDAIAKTVTSAAAPSNTSGQPVSQGPFQSNTLFAPYPAWGQDFSAAGTSQLDNQYWEALVGPAQNSNDEAEYYTADPANLRVENGALVLEATHQPEPSGYNYASARIDTQGKKTFLYGRIDITAQLPSGIGTWPAVWFLPATNTYENLSPASDITRYKNGGEIDLIEAVGFNPNVEYGVAHTLTDLSRPGGLGAYGTVTVPGSNTSYNLYSLLWTPTTLTFAVNNQPFYTYTKVAGADYTSWPFDQPFYLIMNLALGGNWGGEDTAAFPGNGIDNSALPASLAIQSIYYYPYVGSTTSK